MNYQEMKKQCPNHKENLAGCNCTYSCPKKGLCCQCIKEHREAGELPACFFPAEVEATYDRSIRRFLQLHAK